MTMFCDFTLQHGARGWSEMAHKSEVAHIRDWSLITERGGGGLQNRKIPSPKLFAPPTPKDS